MTRFCREVLQLCCMDTWGTKLRSCFKLSKYRRCELTPSCGYSRVLQSCPRRRKSHPCFVVIAPQLSRPAPMAPVECACVEHTVGQLFEDSGSAEAAGAAAGDEGDLPNRGRLAAFGPMPAPGPRPSLSSPQLPLSFGEIAAAATTPPPRRGTTPVSLAMAVNSCASSKKPKPPR